MASCQSPLLEVLGSNLRQLPQPWGKDFGSEATKSHHTQLLMKLVSCVHFCSLQDHRRTFCLPPTNGFVRHFSRFSVAVP